MGVPRAKSIGVPLFRIEYFSSNIHFIVNTCQLKRDAQRESCELSFTGGTIRTAARETAPQRALREETASKREWGKSTYQYTILLKRELKHFFYRRFSASHEDMISP